ncbi:hypothetical protein L6164_000690 [Bauhinia variegata]|uniref:Uncharacterized protein n=1 Tax=Bauhinia variegata TaxID=167791 RepID=A0ACB9Q9Y8_BAUVA|nr:hypothetical protein L6164_000690 [Bauhinia variegata]
MVHCSQMSFFFLLLILFIVGFGGAVENSGDAVAGEKNPFTPKAFLLRYWEKKIHNHLPKPEFLLSKASPLTAAESAVFARLAATNSLSSRLPEFCFSAHLVCIPELNANLEKHSKDVNFATYQGKNFTNYGSGLVGGVNSFKNYSEVEDRTDLVTSFRRYSRGSTGRNDKFQSYSPFNSYSAGKTFNSYGTGTHGGAGEFKEYEKEFNLPELRFSSYSDGTIGRKQSFSSYSKHANAGEQAFTSYAKNGNGATNEFTEYSTDVNGINTNFTNYGENSNRENDTFTSYSENANVPVSFFKSYGDGSNEATEKFSNYRNNENAGFDSFKSYAKDSKTAQLDFTNYGNDSFVGSGEFTGYAKGAKTTPKVGFKEYGPRITFMEYNKKGVKFAQYVDFNDSGSPPTAAEAVRGSLVKRWVEPGKFFREKMLKKGTVMPMPDIKDKMLERSFLPRSIVSKLPFSSSKISELKQIFHVSDNSSMEKFMKDSLGDCERAPSKGETKRCVGSIEDMIDFATSVLGPNVAVRSTEGINGSKNNVMVGSVKGINGGKVTQSVSCHQSMFPYMLYYCHSVPKVRVYEADLLDPKTKAKINHGVAICHLDTTAWSPTHGAFMALGSGPGRIEVCHWIFENDMTWTIAD